MATAILQPGAPIGASSEVNTTNEAKAFLIRMKERVRNPQAAAEVLQVLQQKDNRFDADEFNRVIGAGSAFASLHLVSCDE